MPKSVTLVAPEDLLKAVKAAVPSDDALWSDIEPMESPLNPLDDPLGGIPIDYICHIATIIFQTGTFANARARIGQLSALARKSRV